jgi:hypothetical protein
LLLPLLLGPTPLTRDDDAEDEPTSSKTANNAFTLRR